MVNEWTVGLSVQHSNGVSVRRSVGCAVFSFCEGDAVSVGLTASFDKIYNNYVGEAYVVNIGGACRWRHCEAHLRRT